MGGIFFCSERIKPIQVAIECTFSSSSYISSTPRGHTLNLYSLFETLSKLGGRQTIPITLFAQVSTSSSNPIYQTSNRLQLRLAAALQKRHVTMAIRIACTSSHTKPPPQKVYITMDMRCTATAKGLVAYRQTTLELALLLVYTALMAYK